MFVVQAFGHVTASREDSAQGLCEGLCKMSGAARPQGPGTQPAAQIKLPPGGYLASSVP